MGIPSAFSSQTPRPSRLCLALVVDLQRQIKRVMSPNHQINEAACHLCTKAELLRRVVVSLHQKGIHTTVDFPVAATATPATTLGFFCSWELLRNCNIMSSLEMTRPSRLHLPSPFVVWALNDNALAAWAVSSMGPGGAPTLKLKQLELKEIRAKFWRKDYYNLSNTARSFRWMHIQPRSYTSKLPHFEI